MTYFNIEGVDGNNNGYFYLENDNQSIYSYTNLQGDLLDENFLLNFVNKFYSEVTAENFLDNNFNVWDLINTDNNDNVVLDVELTLPNGKPYKLIYEYMEEDVYGNNCKLISEYNGYRTTLLIFNGERMYSSAGSDYVQGFGKTDGMLWGKTYDVYDLKMLIVDDIQPKLSVNVDQNLIEEDVENLQEKLEQILIIQKEEKVYKSSAELLRNSISTWYKVMLEIALVGLLSVLVYVSIRMIITSIAEEKAKYKKMLTDWVAAVCIIFLMHFLMSITFTCTQAINDIFNANLIGENGEDVLMSGIRNEIAGGGYGHDWESFADNVIYLVLVILTVMFTWQYLKRFIYVAFLTMIAPIVALTYPLDEIKDGQAQAFGMWLREFVFSVLIQPVHLVTYYVILGMTTDLMDKTSEVYNPIYAIVAISFMLPAEKFIRKMFGFEKSEANKTIGSALGGATLMKGINKLGAKGGFKGKGGTSGGEASNETSKVRMANKGSDTYEALRNKNAKPKASNAQTKQNKPKTGKKMGNKAKTKKGKSKQTRNQKIHQRAKIGAENVAKQKAQIAKANAQNKGKTQKANLKNSAGTKKGKWGARLKGGLKVAGKYGKNVARGAMRVAGAATLGTIGLAAGIATGDMSNAVAGLTGGITAGSKLGASAVDGAINLAKGANGVRRDIVDTYRGGKLGKDEAERIRFDKDFKKTEGYKNLIRKHEGSEETVQKFLNAGVTDVGKMGKAIEEGYNPEEAIAYMKMANSDECPDEVLNDTESFKTFLEARGIDSSNAEEIRKGIVKFK